MDAMQRDTDNAEDYSDKSPDRGLSEDLAYWRAERPDEWTMDRFIRDAAKLEAEVERLRVELHDAVSGRPSIVTLQAIGDENKRLKAEVERLRKALERMATKEFGDEPNWKGWALQFQTEAEAAIE